MTSKELNDLGIKVGLSAPCTLGDKCQHCQISDGLRDTEFTEKWIMGMKDMMDNGYDIKEVMAQTLAQGFLMGQEASKVGASEAPNYQVNNPQVKEQLILIGRKIKESLLPGYGFTLFLFGYGNNHDLFYLSSARREDMILTIKEFLKRQVQ